jgi:hypothetical protein
MNYLKIYCNLIRKAEKRTLPEGYTEKHHTFPKSIFGNNNRIVVLTAREHYIAHALLVKVYKNRYGISHKNTHKMLYAYNLMYNSGKCNTSGLYEYYKKYFCEYHPNKTKEFREKKRIEMLALGENNPAKTDKFRKEQSKMMCGDKNPMKREDVRKKISEQMSKRMMTDANPTRGKKRPEHADKICKYDYILTSPEGIEYNTINLTNFCKEKNLNYDALRRGKMKWNGWEVVSRTLRKKNEIER